MHDRIIGALATCCRQGEMLRLHNRDVDFARHQIVIRGANARDAENRRIPFDPLEGGVTLRHAAINAGSSSHGSADPASFRLSP